MSTRPLRVALILIALMSINAITMQFLNIAIFPTITYWISFIIFIYSAYQSVQAKNIHPLIYGYFALIIYMAILGLAYDNDRDGWFRDLVVQLFLLTSVVIGYSIKDLRPILRAFIYVIIIGAIINVIAILTSPVYIRGEITNELSRPLSYKVQYVLTPVLVLFFVKEEFLRINKSYFYLIFVIFFLYFFEQLLFGKRVMFIKFFIIILLNIYYYYNVKNKSLKSMRIIFFIIVVLVMNELFGHSLKGFYDALIARFYSEGTIVHTFEEDGRMATLNIVLSNLVEKRDIFLGLGLGGAIIDPSVLGNDVKITRFEIGQMSPLIHGGVMFWLFVNYFFIYILTKIRAFRSNPVDFGLWMAVLVFYIFSFMESIFTTNLICYETLIFIIMGYLLNRIRIYENEHKSILQKVKRQSNRLEFK